MGSFILKTPHPVRPYLEWSTIMDAPITRGMSEEELRDHVKEEYGNEGLSRLPQRMARVREKGVSSYEDESPTEAISLNRAGEKETRLTMDQIVDYYCERQCVGEKPTGAPRNSES